MREKREEEEEEKLDKEAALFVSSDYH